MCTLPYQLTYKRLCNSSKVMALGSLYLYCVFINCYLLIPQTFNYPFPVVSYLDIRQISPLIDEGVQSMQPNSYTNENISICQYLVSSLGRQMQTPSEVVTKSRFVFGMYCIDRGQASNQSIDVLEQFLAVFLWTER